jgi:predicted ArsR family transcriptional regulator
MPWIVDRFEDCLKPYTKQSEIAQLMEKCGGKIEKNAKPQEKAAWTKCLMDNFEAQFPEDMRVKVMEDCGRRCISHTTIDRVKRIKKNTKNLEDLVNGLNVQWRRIPLGGPLTLEGNKIHFAYSRCYCGMVSKTKERFSPTYCNCSRGWVLELFESIFEKPVKVELVSSIIQGAKHCEFVIEIPKQAKH